MPTPSEGIGLKERIPPHMIILRKLKKEDTGTYDNTTEVEIIMCQIIRMKIPAHMIIPRKIV